MIEKLKKGLDKSIVSITVKSSTYLEIEKLKAKVSNVEEQILKEKQNLGMDLFEQWKATGEINEDLIKTTFALILEQQKEIASYQEEIVKAEAEKDKILNEGSAPVQSTQPADGVVCTCGTVNSKEAKFCKGCGKKLEEVKQEEVKTEEKKYCPSCHAPQDPGARFCGECGTPID